MEISSTESIIAIKKDMSTDFDQKTQQNYYTSVQPMVGCQNGLIEDRITQYAQTQVSFSDGDVPLCIVKPVKHLNKSGPSQLSIY